MRSPFTFRHARLSPDSDALLARRIHEISASVLVLGHGISTLAVVRRLAGLGIRPLVVETNPDLVGASRFFRGTPGPAEGSEANAKVFGEWMDHRGFEKVVLVPCSDNWLVCVSPLPEALGGRVLASVSSPASVQSVVDKGLFARFMENNGFRHPRTKLLQGPADLDAVDEEFLSSAFLKPTRSQDFYQAFRCKAVKIRSRSDAREWIGRIANTGLQVMLQELVPGPPEHQFCVDGFVARNGTLGGLFARQWLRKYPEDFGESSLSASVPLENLGSAVAMVCRAVDLLSLRGMFSVEIKKDERDGEFRILEINARPWWWVGFTCESGVDVCRMMIQDVLGDDVEPLDGYQVGRYSAYPSRDWYSYRTLPRVRREGYPTLLRRWLLATQPVFSWRDPGPALSEIRRGVARRLRRLLART